MNRTARLATSLLSSVVTTAAVLTGLGATAGPAGAAPPFTVLDNQQKQGVEVHVLEAFVPFAESFWRPSDIPDANTGRYLATGAGVTQPRGAGDIAFAYATLMTAEPDQQTFGGVSRATLLDHTIRSIRYEALTNVLSGAGYNTWGGNTWQASLEMYNWADAAHLLWDHLDADTQALVRKVVTGEADILITKPVATGTPGNTGAEDNGWNTPTPALAAVMFPDDPNRTAWDQTAIKLALNASSTAADATSGTVVDGKPLSSWMASVNLNDDLTIENHGFFNPIYQQVTHTNIDDAAIFYAQGKHPLPQAFSFRTQEIWDKILGPLADDNGDIDMPAGQDWTSKDYQHLEYLSVLATRFGDDDASVLESRALQTVAKRQATHPNGSILAQPDLGYESMLVKRMAASWWNHQLFGPSPAPTQSEFDAGRARTAGVTQFPSVDVIAARLPGASAFMSWDSERPMGLWIPSQNGHEDDPVFTYYAPGSLVGSATGTVSAYNCACAKDRFSTAGVIGGRDFSMTEFPDGVALLLDRGTGSTFTYSLEQIPGVTGDRTVYSAGGSGLGSLPGNWVNVADRMGMVVLGGAGIAAADVHSTNDSRLITGSTGTGSGSRGALLVPNVDHAATAGLADDVRQPSVPDGWSALTARAPDGTDRLAVGRWAGPADAPLSITDDRGAPVPVEPARISGSTSSFTASLHAPASEGETLRFFVKSDGPLLARQDGEHRILVTNNGSAPVHSTTTYLADDGTASSAQRVIAPGETTVARVVQGRLTLAGAEYEHLLAARSTLTTLLGSVRTWQAQHRLSRADAARLGAEIAVAVRAIDSAAGTATSSDPDTNREAAAVAVAASAVRAIRPSSSMPPDIRSAVSDAAASAGEALAQARDELSVQVGARLVGTALPGEPVTVRITMFNRGLGSATHGSVALTAPAGWTLPSRTPAFDALAPGASTTVDVTGSLAATAAPGPAELTASLTYRATGAQRTTSASADVTVQPLYTLAADLASVPLAAGGWNRTSLTLHSNAAKPIDVSVAAHAPTGVSATLEHGSITVPANGDATDTLTLTNAGQTTGTGELGIEATSSTGVSATATEKLLYSTNLANNPTQAPFPAAFADSSQSAYPPALADDGAPGTFWVSGGPATAGNGPTPAHPVALGVDLGTALPVGSVTVTPRTGYGPKSYDVQTSTDGNIWTTVASVVDGPNATRQTTFPATSARYVRVLITADYDRTNRNVQVAEFEIRSS